MAMIRMAAENGPSGTRPPAARSDVSNHAETLYLVATKGFDGHVRLAPRLTPGLPHVLPTGHANRGVMDPRQLYIEHLGTIDRISESMCRRNGVRGADAEDFASDVKLKLLQDDYAVLRKYRGASSTTTFLTVVIANLFRDYRVKAWGRWRPSAEAKRRGETAVLLETAIYRDGRS